MDTFVRRIHRLRRIYKSVTNGNASSETYYLRMWIPQRIYYFRFSIEYPRLILFNITFVEDIDVCARIACAYCGVISAPTVDIRSILRSLALCAEVPCRLQTGHRKPSKSELNTVVPLANFSNPCVSFLTFAVPRYYCGELSDPRPTSLSPYCVCSADYCDAYLTHDSVRRQKLMQLRSE